MENWPGMTNTGTGPGAGADGAFERFLTAAIATIITIMFSWRLLVENETVDEANIYAAYRLRQAMLTEGGATGGSPDKKRDGGRNDDKKDRRSSDRDRSTHMNSDITYGGHDLMERKHNFTTAAQTGSLPVEGSTHMDSKKNDNEGDDDNIDDPENTWGSYSWEEDLYGSVHTRRKTRDVLTSANAKLRTKSESSDQSYTAGSDSSDTDPGSIDNKLQNWDAMDEHYINREYRGVDEDYDNNMEVSSDESESSESDAGDYEPPIMDDSDDENIHGSFSNLLEPIIEEDSDDIDSSSSNDDEDDDESNEKTTEVSSDKHVIDEHIADDAQTEITCNINEPSLCAKDVIDGNNEVEMNENDTKCECLDINEQRGSVNHDGVDKVDEILHQIQERSRYEVNEKQISTAFFPLKNAENLVSSPSECTGTESDSYRINPEECVKENQSSVVDQSPCSVDLNADDHVGLFTSDMTTGVSKSLDQQETERDLSKERSEIDNYSTNALTKERNIPSNLARVDIGFDGYTDDVDSLPASPIRTCALDDLNDGYISDESCSSASVVTIVSLRTFEDEHRPNNADELDSEIRDEDRVGMEKSSSVIHIPQLTADENVDEDDQSIDKNENDTLNEGKENDDITYNDFVKDIEECIVSSDERLLSEAPIRSNDNTEENDKSENIDDILDGLDEVLDDNDFDESDRNDIHDEDNDDYDIDLRENGQGSPRHLSLDEPYFSGSQSEDSEGPREYNPYEDDFAEFHIDSDSDEDTFYLVMGDKSHLRKLDTMTNLASIGVSPQGTKVQESEDGKTVVFSKTEEIFSDHHVRYFVKDRDSANMSIFDRPITEEKEDYSGEPSNVQSDVRNDGNLSSKNDSDVGDSKRCDNADNYDHIKLGARISESSSAATTCSSLSDNIHNTNSSLGDISDVQDNERSNQKVHNSDSNLTETLLSSERDMQRSKSEPIALKIIEDDLSETKNETNNDQCELLDTVEQNIEPRTNEIINAPLQFEEEHDSGIQCISNSERGNKSPSSDQSVDNDVSEIPRDDSYTDKPLDVSIESSEGFQTDSPDAEVATDTVKPYDDAGEIQGNDDNSSKNDVAIMDMEGSPMSRRRNRLENNEPDEQSSRLHERPSDLDLGLTDKTDSSNNTVTITSLDYSPGSRNKHRVWDDGKPSVTSFENAISDETERKENIENKADKTRETTATSGSEGNVGAPGDNLENTLDVLERDLSPCIEHMALVLENENKIPKETSSPSELSISKPTSGERVIERNVFVPNNSSIVHTPVVRPSSIKRVGSGVSSKIAKQRPALFNDSSVLQSPIVTDNTASPKMTEYPEKRASLSRLKIQSSRQRFLSADDLSTDPVNEQFNQHKASLTNSLPRQRRYARSGNSTKSRRYLSYERVDHITSLYHSRDSSFQSDESFEKPDLHTLHKNCMFSPHIHDEIVQTTQYIENLGLHEQLMRHGSMTSLIETDLDTGETFETRLADFDSIDFQHIPLQRTASLSDIVHKHRMESRKSSRGRFADRKVPKSKSLMALETDIDDAMTRPGEGNLTRTPSIHELRVAKSLQKLNVPDWYKKSSVSRSGSTYSLLSERRDSTSTLSSIGYAGSIMSAPCPSLSPTNNPVVIRTRVTPTSASRLLMRSTPKLPVTPEKSPLHHTTSFSLPSDKFRNREKPKELMPIPVVPFSKLRLMFEQQTRDKKSSTGEKTSSSKPVTPVKPEAKTSIGNPVVKVTTDEKENVPVEESQYEKVAAPPQETVYENVEPRQRVKNGKVRIIEPEKEKREPPPIPEKPKSWTRLANESEEPKKETGNKEKTTPTKRSFFPQGLRMPKLTKQKSPTHKTVTSQRQRSPGLASEPVSMPPTQSKIETTV